MCVCIYIYIGRVYSVASYKISYSVAPPFTIILYTNLRQCQYIFTIVELL
jgi:hypothetical protein